MYGTIIWQGHCLVQPSIAVLFGSPFGLMSSSEKDLLISCLEVDGLADNILEAKGGKGLDSVQDTNVHLITYCQYVSPPQSLLVFP